VLLQLFLLLLGIVLILLPLLLLQFHLLLDLLQLLVQFTPDFPPLLPEILGCPLLNHLNALDELGIYAMHLVDVLLVDLELILCFQFLLPLHELLLLGGIRVKALKEELVLVWRMDDLQGLGTLLLNLFLYLLDGVPVLLLPCDVPFLLRD